MKINCKQFLRQTFCAAIFVTAMLATATAQDSPQYLPNAKAVFALSGGGGPQSNHPRYYANLELVQLAYQQTPIFNYVASGNASDLVTFEYEAPTPENKSNWKNFFGFAGPTGKKKIKRVEKIKLDADGFPLLVAKVPTGGLQGAASASDLAEGFNKFFAQEPSADLATAAPLIFYVTDHGSNSGFKGGKIVLWDKTYLEAEELSSLLTSSVPDHQSVIMLYDQCFGGNMLKAMYRSDGQLRKNTCGLAAASGEQLAFGGGGTMKSLWEQVQAVKKNSHSPLSLTYRDLFLKMSSDPSITSVPTLSSDVYAQEWHQQHRGSELIFTDLNLFPNTDKLCSNSLDLQKSQKKPAHFLAGSFGQKVRATWERLRAELTFSSSQKDIQNLVTRIAAMEENAETVYKDFYDYQAQFYNPALLQNFKKFYKKYPELIELKKKASSGTSLSPQEIQSMTKMLADYDLFQAALENQAALKISGEPTSSHFPISDELAEVMRENFERKSTRLQAMIELAQLKRHLHQIITLSAIEQMIKKSDEKSLREYISIVECEDTAIIKLSSPGGIP